MKRAQVLPRNWIIGGGFFIAIFAVGVMIISGALQEDASWLDEEQFQAFNETFNKFDEYNKEIEGLQADVEDIAGSNKGNLGFLNDLINQAWNLLTTMRNNFAFLTDMLKGLSSTLGVPVFITTLLISLIGGMFIFSILRVIFNRDI